MKRLLVWLVESVLLAAMVWLVGAYTREGERDEQDD